MNDKKIHITFLASTLAVGGAENILLEVVKQFNKNEFVINIICLKHGGKLCLELRAIGVQVFENVMSGKIDLKVLIRLPKLLRKLSTDVLFVLNHDDAMLWGKICGRFGRVPVTLLWVHSTAIEGKKLVARLINHLTINFEDKVITISKAHKKTVLSRYPRIKNDKLEIIPNGIDINRFLLVEKDNGLIETLGIGRFKHRIGTVARLCPEKALDVLIRAAHVVVEEEKETVFIIVGDGKERGKIERLAERSGLRGHIKFLGARRDVPKILKCLDIAVLSSKEEVFPVFLLEAMASELPVVSTRVGSIEDIVEHGKTGLLTSPGDHHELAARLLELMRDQKMAVEMGREGRRRVNDFFSVEKMVDRMERLVRELLGSKGIFPVL